MAQDSFDHSWHVAAEPGAVFAHLADPHSYLGLSPLIVAVRDVSEGVDDSGQPFVAYTAVERFKAGPVRLWDNPIAVTMRVDAGAARIRQDVVSPGRVRLTSLLVLTPESGGTRLDERIELTMPRLLRGFVRGQARSVQLYRAGELSRRLTATA
ncbi:hypothetical protein F4553_006686 [Allocatelliglobosispora scoriae]|uniref:SRPBCC family protein n=1 Tax=Allocatelliglobosispora scoriae TaxID=643052 RepID=A0A841C2H4_9ACTN|nr:SRPBCC family protein [Allocatelliglobosispora scoriae]MBB5873252.1 hypothetical protein [Allocatelliglobosispora scoriae]